MQFLLFSKALLCTIIAIVVHLQRTNAQQWPYNLPPHQKYFPQHEHLVRRHEEVRNRLASQAPIGIRKMSDDPGEMFFLDYWQFDTSKPLENGPLIGSMTSETLKKDMILSRRWLQDRGIRNESTLSPFLPPLQMHADDILLDRLNFRHTSSDVFHKRSFQCPSGTNNCSSVGDPNICCATEETCVKIDDIGLGSVGCCPTGQKCGGSVSQCNASAGYTSCPGSSNGGCCIPNFSCEDIGCKYCPAPLNHARTLTRS